MLICVSLKSLFPTNFFCFLQKPLLLHGHERSITKIRYNREGDLLFSTAKDNKPTVWYSLNGERLGTYDGHNGAVWTNDVTCILFSWYIHIEFKFLSVLLAI